MVVSSQAIANSCAVAAGETEGGCGGGGGRRAVELVRPLLEGRWSLPAYAIGSYIAHGSDCGDLWQRNKVVKIMQL